MRPSALVPLLFSLVAFILSMLCIFAGSKTGYLENANMLTLNTSMLGQSTLNTSKSSSSILNSIANDVHKEINDVVSVIAKDLNIHDFYSAHVLDYCEGYYTPSAISNSTSHPSKNTTSCSNHTALFHFDPASIIQKELKPGVNLTELKWPSAIQDAVRVVEFASKAMFVLYCIGAGAAGLALIGALVGVMASGRLSAIVNFMTSMLAFLCLLIASAIATGIINKVVDAVNAHGNDIGVAAYKGKTFMGMTWSATILVLLAGFAWVYEFMRGRRERVSYVLEGKEGRY